MRYIVQMRRGTATQWADSAIIPLAGELVVEIDEENNLHKLKIGDGVHTYSELAYLMAGDETVTQILAQAKPRVVTVTLDVTKWQEVVCRTDPMLGYYGQIVDVGNITQQSRLDLQPSADMLAEFQSLNLVFATENEGGIMRVYSIGDMPLKTYTMQATIVETEVVVASDKIAGIPVGTPTTQSDWLQTDTTKSNYIKNKPEIPSIEGLATERYVDEAVADLVETTPEILETLNELSAALEDNSNFAITITEELSKKVDKVEGKGLSTNDYTTLEKDKLATISEGAEVNVQSDWLQTDNTQADYIKNKPEIPSIEGLATEQYVDDAVAGLPDMTPEMWDSLNDLSEFLIENPDFVTTVDNKVDKVDGKGLSTNDYTTKEKEKLASIDENAEQNVQSDWSQTDNTQADYIKNKPEIPSVDGFATEDYVDDAVAGLVDTTPEILEALNALSEALKENPDLSTSILQELGNKVDKVEGKGLSTNDYTTEDKDKLSTIASGAGVNVQSDWLQTNTASDDFIKNKPALGSLASKDYITNSDIDADTQIEQSKIVGLTNLQEKVDNIEAGANNYSLPIASSSTLGGVKKGQYVIINSSGVISVDAEELEGVILPPTTAHDEGKVLTVVDGKWAMAVPSGAAILKNAEDFSF